MADSKQFEEMLECLVNEDKVKAEELFHNIVVEKSREIYENLLEDDLDDEEVDETSDDEVEEGSKEELSPTEQMREYVEKITPKMGDNGANTKSAVAGANNIGNGTASNLAQGADEKGMKAASPKDIASGNVNVPGGKASKSMKAQPKGHGAEKKGAGEGSTDSKPVIGK